MAQTPKMIDFDPRKSLKSSKVSLRTKRLDPYFESLESSVNAKSEYEHVEDGEGVLVATELSVILNGSDMGTVDLFGRGLLFMDSEVQVRAVKPENHRSPSPV